MNIGIIESYNDGFLEIIPEGEYSDYWLIAAIHINGEAFRPSPRFYRNEQAALAKAKKIYDWIAISNNGIQDKELWCEELRMILWHQSKDAC